MNKVRRYLLGMSIGFAGLIGIAACHKGVSAAQQDPQQQPGYDPSDQNMAPVDSSGQPINESQQQAGQYSAGGAPIERRTPEGDQYQAPPPDQAPPPNQSSYAQDQSYSDQDISGEPPVYAEQPPPELPVYDQPAAPGPNYMWTPGYWDYAPIGYYWVPGVWVAAPYPGALWTPCYWGFYGGRYRFYHGYWGLHIGFYGGVNYGFGYYGEGYRGGYWNGNNFYYNRSVSRVSPRITNVYVHNVTITNVGNRVSYNGGRGGLQVQPHPAEVAAMRGPRIPPMSTQRMVQQDAAQNRQQFYSQNQGRPKSATSALPVSADKGIQRPTPVQPGNGYRPGYQNGGQNRPGQPAYQVYPAQPGNAARPGVQPGRQEVAPVNGPHVQPARPVPQQSYRPDTQPAVRPAPEAHPVPQQPQYRPSPQQQVRPNTQYRPETQSRPVEPRPAPEYRSPPPAPRPAAPAAPPQVHTAPPPQQPHPAPAHTEPVHPH